MKRSKLLIAVTTLTLVGVMFGGCASRPPQANFEASVTSGQAPLSVTLSNTSMDADEFQWDFGDGTTMVTSTTEESAAHEYTKVGTHTVTLTAIKKETLESDTTTLTITVAPGAPDTVTLSPIAVAVGGTEQLEAMVTDQYGNQVSDVELVWTVTDEDVASVTQAGLLTAGEMVGSFVEVVEVQVTQGEVVRMAVASVDITPGPLEQIVIAPNLADIGMEITQQFVAVGADKYGNRISGLSFTWSVQNGGGTINSSGLFTAGDTPDTYGDSIKAEATQGSITLSGTVSVTVWPDRIAFISEQNDDQWDIYTMGVDGTNVERLTTTPATEWGFSWSPDGRRLAYDSYWRGGGILVMNDDGSWRVRLLGHEEETVNIFPAWSPDGSKIVFVRATPAEEGIEDLDIFVMDVDGGNVTQLTDTPDADEWVPTWSPDGSKIVYDYSKGRRGGDIYVIDADGSNPRALTTHADNDTNPAWSPDGTQIVFNSNRGGDNEVYVMNADGSNVRQLTFNKARGRYYIYDGQPAWSPDGTKIAFMSTRGGGTEGEIYVMDADGGNVIRLTDNSLKDRQPYWAPRKRGVEVTEAVVIIPSAISLKAMTTQEVTAWASQRVVRIETNLGSGSGFIIRPGGLILTNNHVISDAEEITVYLEDGTSYAGTIEARDLVRDLAVVKIEAADLPYLELGNLSQTSLGQQVIVLGYPLGTETIAVTSGLVSAIEFDGGRNILWVQTDSVINPGNSGGPMLNLQGEVVGVVSAKLVGFGIEGVGFAISANTVNIYLSRLEAGETIVAFS